MEKLISYFFFDYHSKKQSYWFKSLLYWYLILRSCEWLFHFKLLFGENSIVFNAARSIGPVKDLAFILYNNPTPVLSLSFLIIILLISIIHLLGKNIYFISDFILWLLVLNVHNKLYPSLTGGDLLLNQFLLFNCFIQRSFEKKENPTAAIKICLHNLGILAVIIQLFIVYFFSGLAKAADAGWVGGTAIHSVSMIRHFSMHSIFTYHAFLNPLYIFLSYLVLFYQLCFPILVWIKQIKKPLLIIGILMHVYIGLVMGLPEFSAIMIIAYVYFWPSKAQLV